MLTKICPVASMFINLREYVTSKGQVLTRDSTQSIIFGPCEILDKIKCLHYHVVGIYDTGKFLLLEMVNMVYKF